MALLSSIRRAAWKPSSICSRSRHSLSVAQVNAPRPVFSCKAPRLASWKWTWLASWSYRQATFIYPLLTSIRPIWPFLAQEPRPPCAAVLSYEWRGCEASQNLPPTGCQYVRSEPRSSLSQVWRVAGLGHSIRECCAYGYFSCPDCWPVSFNGYSVSPCWVRGLGQRWSYGGLTVSLTAKAGS